jgi:hypothetical protein
LRFVDPYGLEKFPDDFVGPLPPSGYYTSEITDTACGKVPPAPPGVDIVSNMLKAAAPRTPFWFYNQVRLGGPWDYKQIDPLYEDFGNFHYGATGRAFGFPESVLRRMAGYASRVSDPTRRGLGSPLGRFPYGDDPLDQLQIDKGMEFCGCSGY